MQPRTREVLTQLDTHHAALEQAVASVPESQRERRPAPDAWSVAEVVEHLAIVEEGILALLRGQLDAARAAGMGAERETSEVTPTVPVGRLLDRSARLTAGEQSLPTGTIDASEALRRLDAHRRDMRELLLSADGLALSGVVIPHPVLGPLDVYQWLVFVGAHEGRHAKQIEEAGAVLRTS